MSLYYRKLDGKIEQYDGEKYLLGNSTMLNRCETRLKRQ